LHCRRTYVPVLSCTVSVMMRTHLVSHSLRLNDDVHPACLEVAVSRRGGSTAAAREERGGGRGKNKGPISFTIRSSSSSSSINDRIGQARGSGKLWVRFTAPEFPASRPWNSQETLPFRPDPMRYWTIPSARKADPVQQQLHGDHPADTGKLERARPRQEPIDRDLPK
jgi:hypothetical protein